MRRLRLVLGWLAPRIAGGALCVFLLALASYPVVSLLDTPVLIQKIFFTFSQVDQGGGLLMSLPLLAVAGVSVFMLITIERRAAADAVQSARFTANRSSGAAAGVVLLILIIAFGIPFGALVAEAGPLRLFGGEQDNYQRVVARVAPAFADSFLITGLTAAACLPLAYWLGRRLAERGRSWAEASLLLLMAIPSAVVAAAILSQASEGAVGRPLVRLTSVGCAVLIGALSAKTRWARPALGVGAGATAYLVTEPALGLMRGLQERGVGLPVLGLVALFLPVAARLMQNGFAEIDPSGRDAALLANVSEGRRRARIEFPLVLPSLTAAGLLVYVLAFTELSASLLLLRPSWQSVQVRIFNMVHYQRIEEVAALCVLVVVAAGAPLALVQIVRPARRRIP